MAKLATASRIPLRRVSAWVGLTASMTIHAGLYGWAGGLGSGSATAPVSAVPFDAVDARTGGSGTNTVGPTHAPMPRLMVEAGGPESKQNIDDEVLGAGGGSGAERVIWFVSTPTTATLERGLLNSANESELHRLRTAPDRASPFDERATPAPSNDAFLASGDGRRPERRPKMNDEPTPGARTQCAPGDAQSDSTGSTGLGATSEGQAHAAAATHDARPPAPSAGALEATGRRRTRRAHVATGNPDLVRGVPSTDGTWRHPRPRDNADAEALSASETPDALTVTERRGLNPGDGVGGTGSRTAPPGEGGGEGRGGSALARSPGPGEFPALDTSDARYVRWLGAQKRRIGRHLVFPRARRLALDQGTTVLEVRVRRDGTPARHPTLVRSSGFADFDDAARRAVERALPFTPLPPELAPEFQVLRVILPIQFENPVFR